MHFKQKSIDLNTTLSEKFVKQEKILNVQIEKESVKKSVIFLEPKIVQFPINLLLATIKDRSFLQKMKEIKQRRVKEVGNQKSMRSSFHYERASDSENELCIQASHLMNPTDSAYNVDSDQQFLRTFQEDNLIPSKNIVLENSLQTTRKYIKMQSARLKFQALQRSSQRENSVISCCNETMGKLNRRYTLMQNNILQNPPLEQQQMQSDEQNKSQSMNKTFIQQANVHNMLEQLGPSNNNFKFTNRCSSLKVNNPFFQQTQFNTNKYPNNVKVNNTPRQSVQSSFNSQCPQSLHHKQMSHVLPCKQTTNYQVPANEIEEVPRKQTKSQKEQKINQKQYLSQQSSKQPSFKSIPLNENHTQRASNQPSRRDSYLNQILNSKSSPKNRLTQSIDFKI